MINKKGVKIIGKGLDIDGLFKKEIHKNLKISFA